MNILCLCSVCSVVRLFFLFLAIFGLFFSQKGKNTTHTTHTTQIDLSLRAARLYALHKTLHKTLHTYTKSSKTAKKCLFVVGDGLTNSRPAKMTC
jgi:hypothetical protein